MPNTNQPATNGNYTFLPPMAGGLPLAPSLPLPLPPPTMFPRFPIPSHHLENYNVPPMPALPTQQLPEMLPTAEYPPPDTPHGVDGVIPANNYPTPMIPQMNQNGIMIPVPERQFYGRYNNMVVDTGLGKLGWAQCPVYPVQGYPLDNMPQNLFVPVKHEPQRNVSPYSNVHSVPSEDYLRPDYRLQQNFPAPPERRPEWPSNTNDLFSMRHAMPHCSSSSEDMFNVGGDRLAVGADRLITMTDRLSVTDFRADDQELEKELQALERRIDTEFKSTD